MIYKNNEERASIIFDKFFADQSKEVINEYFGGNIMLGHKKLNIFDHGAPVEYARMSNFVIHVCGQLAKRHNQNVLDYMYRKSKRKPYKSMICGIGRNICAIDDLHKVYLRNLARNIRETVTFHMFSLRIHKHISTFTEKVLIMMSFCMPQ